MARRTLRCSSSDKRFTVLRVNNDNSDTAAGRSFEEALHIALPDRGSKVEVFAVCAKDAGEARLVFWRSDRAQRSQFLRSYRVKRPW